MVRVARQLLRAGFRDDVRTSPIVADAMTSRMRIWRGRYRVHIASSASTPRPRAASAMSRASAWFSVMGFSMSTCLPASIS